MTSQEFDAHLKTASLNDCFTYSFNQKEIAEIKNALDKKSWLEEVKILIKEEENAHEEQRLSCF